MSLFSKVTKMILSFQTDWSGQIVQTQIRLLLEEQSDQGLHYSQYCLHLLDALLYGKTSYFQFYDVLVSENLGTLRYVINRKMVVVQINQ